MFESVMGLLRKRRRLDDSFASTPPEAASTTSTVLPTTTAPAAAASGRRSVWEAFLNSGDGDGMALAGGDGGRDGGMTLAGGGVSGGVTHPGLISDSVSYMSYLLPSTSTNDRFNSNNNSSDNRNSEDEQQQQQASRPFNLNERIVHVLDQLDARVERYRKDALSLQEKRDFLLMSIDLIKSHDMVQSMSGSDREEILCYIQRVNSRLSTVDLNVRTVRDRSQEDSLSQINGFIDLMITLGDPVMARQRCQQYLNACCSAAETGSGYNSDSGAMLDMDAGPVDKKFESALLGCTLDDQKNIKKRLQALMDYLNKQMVQYK